jgi:hypothetical protein
MQEYVNLIPRENLTAKELYTLACYKTLIEGQVNNLGKK